MQFSHKQYFSPQQQLQSQLPDQRDQYSLNSYQYKQYQWFLQNENQILQDFYRRIQCLPQNQISGYEMKDHATQIEEKSRIVLDTNMRTKTAPIFRLGKSHFVLLVENGGQNETFSTRIMVHDPESKNWC
ncbi:hypothetical protein PV328_012089, partial [Microctonus aethiopoides]